VTRHILERLVGQAGFMPGWSFELRDTPDRGLRLVVTVQTTDAYDPGVPYEVKHWLAVPSETHNERCWSRWLLEQCLLVQRHEAMEAFTINGVRPFPPGHGGGDDPYYSIGQF
jgi:hypothetical protein